MRIFGTLALLFGALHLAVGLMGLSQYEYFRDTFESMILYAQKNELRGYEAITTEVVTRTIRFVIAFSIVTGVVSLVCGAGLIKRQLWAARAWLVIISISTAVYAYRAVSAALTGNSTVLLPVLTTLLLILLCASWLRLYKGRQ